MVKILELEKNNQEWERKGLDWENEMAENDFALSTKSLEIMQGQGSIKNLKGKMGLLKKSLEVVDEVKSKLKEVEANASFPQEEIKKL